MIEINTFFYDTLQKFRADYPELDKFLSDDEITIYAKYQLHSYHSNGLSSGWELRLLDIGIKRLNSYHEEANK